MYSRENKIARAILVYLRYGVGISESDGWYKQYVLPLIRAQLVVGKTAKKEADLCLWLEGVETDGTEISVLR
jgi:hypothetical protein